MQAQRTGVDGAENVIPFVRGTRRYGGDSSNRAVVLTMSHAGFVRASELGLKLGLSTDQGHRDQYFKELFGLLIGSITAGDGPELQASLQQLVDRIRSEADELEEQLADTPIGDLYGLSARTYGCLTRAGIATVSELVAAHHDGPRHVQGIGSKAEAEIACALADVRNQRKVNAVTLAEVTR